MKVHFPRELCDPWLRMSDNAPVLTLKGYATTLVPYSQGLGNFS